MKRGIAGALLPSTEYVELLAEQLSPSEAYNLRASGLFDSHSAPLEAVMVRGGMTAAVAASEGADAAGAGAAEAGAGDDADADTGIAVVELWRRFDTGLRGEIGRMRAASLKIAADPHWPQLDSFIYIEELRRIFQQTDPMKRELQIHDLRWNFLEELGQAWSGQLGGAIVYYIKLQLLERLQTMESERAHHALSAIYAQCHTQFQEKIGSLTAKATPAETEVSS